MKLNRRSFTGLVLAAMSGLPMASIASDVQTDAKGNPLLTQFSEEGFIDCVFVVREIKETDQHFILQLAASHEGKLVGLKAVVLKRIDASLTDGKVKLKPDGVYRGGVEFHRTGPESDLLLRTIAQLYGQPRPNARMVDRERFAVISLHQGTIDLKNQAVKLKLFGHDEKVDGKEDYYESYFNLDLKNRLVFWNEKDPGYRSPLLKGLSR